VVAESTRPGNFDRQEVLTVKDTDLGFDRVAGVKRKLLLSLNLAVAVSESEIDGRRELGSGKFAGRSP